MPTYSSHGAEVLIVDDDFEASSVLADILDFQGYSVACSHNGKHALEYLRSSPLPRLIILDLQMPVMDGWQFRREQKADQTLSGVPVVVVSGFVDSANIDADTILSKPVDLEQLLKIVGRLVREMGHN